MHLALAGITSTVSVTGDAPPVDSSTNVLGAVVTGREILDLPLNGRNFTQLGPLQAGAVPLTSGLIQAGGPLRQGESYAVNGGRPKQNTYTVDGAQNMNRMDTRNFFSTDVQPLKQNQFDGTVGGPIRRDRLFLFGYYEGFRNRQGITTSALVASAAERSGDFSGLGRPLLNLAAGGKPFPENKLPGINSIASNVLKLYPFPSAGANDYITSLVKALGLVAVVIAAFTISVKAGSTALLPDNSFVFVHPHSVFLGLMLALKGVVITYDGWYAPLYFIEEDKDPTKNLPRSMIGAALSCIAIFLLVNAALYHVLHMNHLAGSQMPALDAAMLLFGSYGRRIILLIAAVGVISSANGGLMYTPRILFSTSRDGLLPRSVTSVNRGGTPSLALFLCAVVSILVVLSGSFDALIAISSVLFVAVYLSGFASLLILRRTEPDLPRPYKAW